MPFPCVLTVLLVPRTPCALLVIVLLLSGVATTIWCRVSATTPWVSDSAPVPIPFLFFAVVLAAIAIFSHGGRDRESSLPLDADRRTLSGESRYLTHRSGDRVDAPGYTRKFQRVPRSRRGCAERALCFAIPNDRYPEIYPKARQNRPDVTFSAACLHLDRSWASWDPCRVL